MIREKIAEPLGLSEAGAAAAVYAVVNAKMAGMIDLLFSRRGYDPREFILCAAGGAAAAHAIRIMQELRIKRLTVPKVAPVYCAFGMMYADLKHNYTRSYLSETAKVDLNKINELFDEMEATARKTLKREGVASKDMLITKSMDMRYYGQVREQTAAMPDGPVTAETLQATAERFHEQHRKVIGYADSKYPTEIVRLHLAGIAKVTPPKVKPVPTGTSDPSQAVKGERKAFFKEFNDFVKVKIYEGDKLLADNVLAGPCIVEERMTTLVIPPDVTMKVDTYGNYTTV